MALLVVTVTPIVMPAAKRAAGRRGRRMGTALRALAAAALLARAAGFCDYGALPGYWDGEEWQLVGSECRLARLTGSLRSLPADDDVDILLVGDSFDRCALVRGVFRIAALCFGRIPLPARADKSSGPPSSRLLMDTASHIQADRPFHAPASKY